MNELITSIFTPTDIRWDFVLGGFGLFLFGIKFLGDGLKAVAGDKLRDYIEKYTSKTWMGLIVGAAMTVLIQSSSATTAITIGFVRAGLMRLEQAVGIIMGANVGTTMTSFLIGLKIENFSLYIIFVGSALVLFSKSKKLRSLGQTILGFGIMFFGLKTMGDELKLLSKVPIFTTLTEQMSDHPLLALSGGIVMTAMIQSSSAMIGIVQKIYESGGMTLEAALPFVFGSNIGTTITAIMAAIGGSIAAKRAAGIHTLFNVLGTIVGLLLLRQFLWIDSVLTDFFDASAMMQISIAHILFNIAATVALYPFIKLLVKLIKTLIKGEEEEERELEVTKLDPEIIKTLPTAALTLSKAATIRMGDVAIDCFEDTRQYLMTKNKIHWESVMQMESIINSMDTKITDYLLLIARENLNENDSEEYTTNLQVCKNLERIGDLSTNLVEFYELIYDNKEVLSESALNEINQMMDLVTSMIQKSMLIYKEKDFELHTSLLEDENYLDLLEYKAKQNHFIRLSTKECLANVGGSLFIDILGTIERIGDHACNISKNAVNIHVTHDVKTTIA